MIQGNATQLEEREEEADTTFGLAKQRFRKVLVPLAMSMLCGPGSITTVLLYSFKAQMLQNYLGLSVILIATFTLLYVSLAFSYKIETRVDDLFFIAFTRIFGILVAAIAIQFMVEGLAEVFPAWMDGSSVIEDKKVRSN